MAVSSLGHVSQYMLSSPLSVMTGHGALWWLGRNNQQYHVHQIPSHNTISQKVPSGGPAGVKVLLSVVSENR